MCGRRQSTIARERAGKISMGRIPKIREDDFTLKDKIDQLKSRIKNVEYDCNNGFPNEAILNKLYCMRKQLKEMEKQYNAKV
jgi:redox-regulated HSP33 family molecular chaperone